MAESQKSGLFYGWWIVGGSFLISILLGGVVLYGFTAIFEPVSVEQNWSYTQVSLASSIRSVEAGLLAPLTGWLVDRLGPRRMIFAGGLIVALGLFVVSRATSLGMFYGGFALIAIGNDCCGMTVMVTAVTHWFKRRLGLASGLTVAGYGFGGLVIPIMVALIDSLGWRGAVSILAIAVLVVVVPLSLLFRHKPEKYGLVPDGKEAPVSEMSHNSAAEKLPEVNFSFKQALKSRSFWLLVIAFAGQNIALQAVVVHVMPYSTSIGIQRATASIIATMIPVTSIVGRISFGWLGDKVKRRWMVLIAFALSCVGLLAFASIPGIGFWLVVPFLICFGIGYGGINALRPPFAREFFGKGNFGTIFGTIIGISSLSGMLGPVLGGLSYDNFHSYTGLWMILAILPVVSIIAITLTRPRRVLAPAATKA